MRHDDPSPRRVRELAGPRTLLPLDTLAPAAVAVQVHRWEPGVRSGCLPAELLGPTDALRRAAESESGNWGPSYAKQPPERAGHASSTPPKLG
ncbi:hypothetical protein GCM10010253_44230 [Streptomyces badius]|uniref:Uncharacterized protein n=1 Tax=Streptomyces badius TaxID=1941 RepID=A0ABQ2TD82_STRBA|nr:hypothetical protein GCM10010253_44230 [Streptomyces badius]